jgi:hypothetical protein
MRRLGRCRIRRDASPAKLEPEPDGEKGREQDNHGFLEQLGQEA